MGKKGASPVKTGLSVRSLERYFRRCITKYATTKSPATAYNASNPGKPRNPPLAVADAVAAAAVAFVVAFAVLVAVFVTFVVAFIVAVCAKATVDPAIIEKITKVAKTAEKSFLLTIFHLQYRLSSVDA
jgi:hypothetical protein